MSLNPNRSSLQVVIEPVRSRQDLEVFYKIPFQVYKKTPQWVAPFHREVLEFFSPRNLLWSHADYYLFLARRDGIAVGRIAVVIDHLYCKSNGDNVGFFGFFECIDEYACAEALFTAAEEWLSSKGMAVMCGPVDGRVDVGCGFQVTGFDAPQTILATYSPPYYAQFAERFGMTKAKDLLTFTIDLTKPLPEKLVEKAGQCRAAGVQIRPFNRLRTGKELRWWVDLFLETFRDHWGFVPVDRKEVLQRFGVKQLRWIVDSRMFLVAEQQGTPIAYLWATPEYNQLFRQMKGRMGIRQILSFLRKQRSITVGKLHFIGIKKEYRDKLIASYLNYAALVEMQRRGYRSAEVGWIDEENTAARTTIAITGASVSKVHRVFEKTLSEEAYG